MIFARVAYFCSFLTVRIKEITLSVECETSSSQPRISQHCRPCTFYLFLDREMLRWYLTASKLTAFKQSQADQDLSGPLFNLSARYRVNFNNINSLQTTCFSVLQYLNSKTSNTGGGGSDFLSFQTLASSEQISSFSSFLSNACFWFSSHIQFC